MNLPFTLWTIGAIHELDANFWTLSCGYPGTTIFSPESIKTDYAKSRNKWESVLTPEEKEVVNKAVEIISDPTKWTALAFARNKDREAVDEFSSSAVCWCAWGALNKSSNDNCITGEILDKFYGKYSRTLSGVNDREGWETVIKMLLSL